MDRTIRDPRRPNIAADLGLDDADVSLCSQNLSAARDATRDRLQDSLACQAFFETHPELEDEDGLRVVLAHAARRAPKAGLTYTEVDLIIRAAFDWERTKL